MKDADHRFSGQHDEVANKMEQKINEPLVWQIVIARHEAILMLWLIIATVVGLLRTSQ